MCMCVCVCVGGGGGRMGYFMNMYTPIYIYITIHAPVLVGPKY